MRNLGFLSPASCRESKDSRLAFKLTDHRGPSGIPMGNHLSIYLTDFIARFDGPLHFRLIAQPLMAILLAIRDGRRDAREGHGAYIWKFVHKPEHRRRLLASGAKSISKVFVLAFALDVAYQFLEWGGLKPLQALLTDIVLAVVPYVCLRGPINRIMSISRTRRSHA